MTHWYEEAFGELYPVLYAHRDEGEARAIARLAASRRPLAGLRLLDLATGSGRVARALAGAGARVLGLDLSAPLLEGAREAATETPLVRGDMRWLPVAGGSMDGVLMIFTSFGYFETDAMNFGVLDEVARVLRPGGFAMIDVANPVWVRDHLVPRSERRVGELSVREARRFEGDGRRLVKEIASVRHRSEGWKRDWKEDVRIYEPDRIRRELEGRQLSVATIWGNYEGDGVADDRPRAIFWAERCDVQVTPAEGGS